VPFPAADWPSAPLPAGVDGAAIDAAVDVAFGAPDAEARVRSVVVVQGGAIVYERYHPLDGPDQVMSSYSVAKSFTSAIVGLLVAEGKLVLDEHPPRPEWPAGDPRTAITLRQLLQMSSGLQWDEVQSLVSMGMTMLSSPSAAAIMAAQPLEREPGTEFEYSTGTSVLVAGIAADALGSCAALDRYVHERLLDPLGITTAAITMDGGGCFVGGFGMDMTTRDFARFGLLYLRGGRWDGEQLLPTAWIEETREPAPTSAQYGLHWWLGPASFSAEGLFGQRIVVVPGSDLVIAINSTQGGDPFALGNAILGAFGATP
jgi:CubicO group peptidase (beta-lactamase class C family)